MGDSDVRRRASRTLDIRDEHTAATLGSGDVPVLGTPAVLALAEEACVAALADDLDAGQTSLGTWVELEHRLPSPVGARVEAEATLIARDGRRLEFEVVVRQEGEVVAEARHRRVLVDRERFLERVGAPAG